MDEIVIVEHNPNWKLFFKEEVTQIREVLDPNLITRIEHFGSTAIPGLAAKPIIDLLVGVTSLHEAKRDAVSLLESLGYAYWHDNPNPHRMFFVKGLPPNSPRTHHIHMVEPDSILWERLLFRDYLRENRSEAARYEQLKRDLAQRFKSDEVWSWGFPPGTTSSRSDREAYTAGKAEYIKSVMEKAIQQQ